tara:strand:+ start:15101 stop:21661 length:6561 start_codon:yes stop_codon:yes gene_type:complete
MAKFSDFQDLNNDGLVDKCVVELPIKQDPCPTCIPNPHAIRPDWTKKSHLESYLNQRTCEYTIIFRSNYKDTGGTGNSVKDEQTIVDRWEEYKEDAVKEILEAYAKDTSPTYVSTTSSSVKYDKKDWYLSVIPNSRIKFKYRIPAEVLNSIPEAPQHAEAPTAPIEVEYDVNELRLALIRISKGLHLYSRYIRVFQAVEGGRVTWARTGARFNLDPYGDKTGKLRRILPELLKFYWSKGWVLNGSLLPGFGKKDAEKIAIGFNENYTIKYMSVWQYGCEHAAYTLKEGQLSSLKNKTPFNDPTAMAYLSKVFEMENDLISRVPKDWLEFLEEYTYPALLVRHANPGEYDPFAPGGPIQQQTMGAINDALAGAGGSTNMTAGDCIADDFAQDFKEIKDFVHDQVMGLGDVIAYKFRDKICGTEDSARQDAEDVGWFSVYDPKTRKNKNVYLMAQEQAFAQLEANDQVFVELCARLFSLLNVSGGYQKMDELWAQVFSPLKECGLSELLSDVIKCLLGGLSLEEAMAKAILSALNAMGIESFGKLFVGLPPDKQREIEAIVWRRLESGDVPGFEPERMRATPPWESDVAKAGASQRVATGVEDSPVPVDRGPPYSAPSTRRTLGQQFDTAINDPYQGVDPNNILQVYIAALIDVYGDNLLDLVDEINKIPGVPVITAIIATLDCPRPPIFDPGLFDWLKDIQLPWCRNQKDIGWPRINMAPPMSLADIFKALLEAAKEALLEMIMNILTQIIIKICEILGDMICKALEAVGALAAALPSLISGENSVSNVLRDVFCGPDASQEQIEQVTARLIGTLGGGGAAMADRGLVNNWTAGVSSMITQRELAELFTGRADDSTINIIHEFTQLEVPEFADALASPTDIRNLFKNIGDLFPPEFTGELLDIVDADDLLADKPINPSLCATPEKLDDFKAARCALLEGRATKEQCDKLYDDLKDQLLDDLEDISTVFQKGVKAHIADQLPPLVSAPGCQDGLLPFEPEEHRVAREKVQESLYKEIKVAYTQDLVGDGPWAFQWGALNLILSDVNGVAYTAHQKKAQNMFNYVDFINESGPDPGGFPEMPPLVGELMGGHNGAFPVDVAGWLQDYVTSGSYRDPTVPTGIFKPIEGWHESQKRKIIIEPSPTIYSIFGETQQEVAYVMLPGYKMGDLRAKFRDNAKGMPNKFKIAGVTDSTKGLDGENEAYGYGFDMWMSTSDLEVNGGDIVYRDGDWTSLRIYERRNNAYSDIIVANDSSISAMFPMGAQVEASLGGSELGVGISRVRPPNSKLPHTAIIREHMAAEVNEILNSLPPVEYGLRDGKPPDTPPSNKYLPQVQRLASFLEERKVLPAVVPDATGWGSGTVPSSTSIDLQSLEDLHGNVMNLFSDLVFQKIAEGGITNPAFNFGAAPDGLSPSDIMYVNPDNYTDDNGDFHAAGQPYSIPSSEAVMGISAAQYSSSPIANRIHYLNPATFGGTYASPGIYIEPPKNDGWLGLFDAIMPEEDGCKPRRSDLIDFADVGQRVNDLYTKIPDDPRLRMGPECRLEVPYARILDRASAAGIEGVVMIAIRAFASMHFIKAIATYSKFKPVFPDNFSSIVSSFIIQEMETRFKENENVLGDTLFKDERFWYAFLEQCVQIYDRKVTLGEVEPPAAAIQAFRALNDLQETYDYPDMRELRKAKSQGLQYLDKTIHDVHSLRYMRNVKNLHYVRDTEMHAKNIMKYLVEEELNKLGEIFTQNLKDIGFGPRIKHLGKYFISRDNGAVIAGTSLRLDQEFYISATGLPLVEGNSFYTSGGEFAKQDGSEYIGQYHVHVSEGRGPIAMEGPFHKSTPHEELIPISKDMRVIGESGDSLGDVTELGDSPMTFAADGMPGGSGEIRPFKLEKLMRITPKASAEMAAGLPALTSSPSGYVQPRVWTNYINNLPSTVKSRNISDYYGNLEFVYDPQSNSEEPIGLKAGTSIGVEYGLRLSIVFEDGTSHSVAETFVDALDKPIAQFEEFNADSRILYCLVNNLVDSPEFKFITEYVFPLRKITAFAAIYNSYAFLPSVGELVTKYDSTDDLTAKKPGRRVDGSGAYDEENSIRGWEPYGKRMRYQQNNNPATWFEKGFDEWDREVLKSTVPKIRSLFKSYYNARDFDWGEDAADGVGHLLEQMRESIRPPAGAKYLPWWKKRKLRKRPLNKNGGMCSSSDED